MIVTVKDLLKELEGKNPDTPIGEALSLTAKMDIYNIYRRECDEEDCIWHLKQKGYETATNDKEFMDNFVSRYRRKFDSEYGTWDNIEATILYFEDDLKKYNSEESDNGEDDSESDDNCM